MRIAHISDLHINSLIRETHIDMLAFLLKKIEEENYDHLIITGDISDQGEERDLLIVRDLLRQRGLLNSKKTTVIIGNHDIFGGLEKLEDIFTFPDRCRNTDYDEKLRHFRLAFRETFDTCCYVSRNNGYPFAKLVNNVLLIGLNSVPRYASLKNPFASRGSIDNQQLIELKQIVTEYGTDTNAILVLQHHHFSKSGTKKARRSENIWGIVERQTLKLKNKRKIALAMKLAGVSAVFHGHYHESKEYYRYDLQICNAGGSIKGNKKGQLRYNEITIRGNQISTIVHTLDYIYQCTPEVNLNDYLETAERNYNRYMELQAITVSAADKLEIAPGANSSESVR